LEHREEVIGNAIRLGGSEPDRTSVPRVAWGDRLIDRREFMSAVGAGIAVVALAAEAQQSARLPRIGFLLPGNVGAGKESFSQGLRELGYVEGRTAVIEWRWWEGKPERLRPAAAEMVRLNPDVVVVGGSEATNAMKEATRSIPIVFIGPSYPVEEGLVESFARPGGNITGITVAQSDHVAKHLQLLLDVVPALADVGVIWSPANPGSTFIFRDTETAARNLKLKVLQVPMASAADVEPALAAIARARPGALIVQPVPTPIANAERIGELAIRLRIPSITAFKSLMERGLLMSYGADNRDVARRIPGYVDRILKGAKPADMPVERPTKFELAINMKTAKAIGLTIPSSLLARADEVIQ
jgi:putative ABC transport system substrate-binding protein